MIHDTIYIDNRHTFISWPICWS